MAVNMEELKVTLKMLDINLQDYWKNNKKHGDIICTDIFNKQLKLKLFIIDLLENNGFKYKIKKNTYSDQYFIIYNKRW